MKVEVQITSLEEEKIVIYCKEITEEILYFEAVDKKYLPIPRILSIE